MINPKGKKLEKLLFGMFDDAIQGVDTYNHNGSMWLIFTDEMKWVVEYTKEQTLWYNYHLFKQEMEIIGLDCVENCDIIKKWFESKFLNINPVEDTIQNGVKDTQFRQIPMNYSIEDTIQNGVKETHERSQHHEFWVKDTIQNGVKHCEDGDWLDGDERFEDIIKDGVKNLGAVDYDNLKHVEDIIENGVKETYDDCSNNIARVEGIIRIGEKIS